MGGRGASSSNNREAPFKLKEGFSLITDKFTDKKEGYPIERETEKAVMLSMRSTVSAGYGYNRRTDDMYERTRSEAIWLPKSQIQIKNNRVVAMPDWLAKRNGFHTTTYKGMK